MHHSQILTSQVIVQLLDGFEYTGTADLKNLLSKLKQVDDATTYKTTPDDYYQVAEAFVFLMNYTLSADKTTWYYADYGNLFTNCRIVHHQDPAEDVWYIEFTLRFGDIKFFNTVKFHMEKVWSESKFIECLKAKPETETLHDVTMKNFFESTLGEWEHCKLTEPPSGSQIIQRSDSGSVQFTLPNEPDVVYRISDHWGSGIGQCNWYLKGFRKCNSFVFKKENNGKLFCGKIKLVKLYCLS